MSIDTDRAKQVADALLAQPNRFLTPRNKRTRAARGVTNFVHIRNAGRESQDARIKFSAALLKDWANPRRVRMALDQDSGMAVFTPVAESDFGAATYKVARSAPHRQGTITITYASIERKAVPDGELALPCKLVKNAHRTLVLVVDFTGVPRA